MNRRWFPSARKQGSWGSGAAGTGIRPKVNGVPEVFREVGKGSLWLDTSKFAAPAPAAFGNVGRNVLRGPGLVSLDFSVFRKFPITERVTGEFRMESFNFTNTPHFNNPMWEVHQFTLWSSHERGSGAAAISVRAQDYVLNLAHGGIAA